MVRIVPEAFASATELPSAEAPPGAVIEAVEVVKLYGERRALAGVTLSVRAGEVLAILGPNGAGKTTLLEILEGHRRRDSGRVSVLGRDPDRPTPEWRAAVGIVLQEQGLQPVLTVREALTLYAGYYPSPRPVEEVLELVGLGDRAEDRVETLSGGGNRRLDVGLGIIGNPAVLFLDEPTTGFDPDARRNMWRMVRALRDNGTTVILTTHYLDEATALADRLVVIRDGGIVARGTPASIAALGGPPTIRFTVPPDVHPPRIPGHPLSTEADGTHSIRTENIATVLAALTRWAERSGSDLADLTISRHTLEDVYLELIT